MKNLFLKWFLSLLVISIMFIVGLSGCYASDNAQPDYKLPEGRWCDIDGDTVLEFDNGHMKLEWGIGQKGSELYSVRIKLSEHGVPFIANKRKNQYGFGDLSELEIIEDSMLLGYENHTDGSGHQYRFVQEYRLSEERAVKDFSEQMPKAINSNRIEYISLILDNYNPPGMSCAEYIWNVSKQDDGKYVSSLFGQYHPLAAPVISDKREVDEEYVAGIEQMIEDDRIAEHNGMFLSHYDEDVQYSLYVRYESGEEIKIRVGSRALDRWCVDNDRYIGYAMDIISENSKYKPTEEKAASMEEEEKKDNTYEKVSGYQIRSEIKGTNKYKVRDFVFYKADPELLPSGTSKLFGVYEEEPVAFNSYYIGQLMTLFGEPDYITENNEDLLSYVIAAKHKNEYVVYIEAYYGASGPSIGGLATDERAVAAADELIYLIKDVIPKDYELSSVYEDIPVSVKMGVKEGMPYYETENIDGADM